MTTQSFTGSAQRVEMRTPIDLIGELIDIHRLPEESLKDFKNRILDVYIHPANASYNGLWNSVARELGEESWAGGLVIDVDRTNDIPNNPNSDIVISTRYITLTDGTTTLSIDKYDRAGTGYFVGDLTDTINTSGLGFTTVTWGAIGNWEKSSYLKRVSSKKTKYKVPLFSTNMHTMYGIMHSGNWFTGDISFSQDTKVTTEAASLATIASGEYYLGQFARTVYTGDYIASGTVSFSYQDFPLVIPISTISINEFRDGEFLDLITEQIENEFSNFIDGAPTVEGAQFINELLSVVPMYYGK